MKPHKHKDLIIAWANGAQIESWNELRQRWEDEENPDWVEFCVYRLKQSNKYNEVLYTCVYPWKGSVATSTAAPNLKLIFNQQNGKLQYAEVLNG